MNRRIKITGILLLGILLLNPSVFAATYKVDPDHSTVSFKIRHILSNIQGYFRQFEGSFEYDPAKPETWKAEATIQAASIDTNVEKRDNHLRSADFFDVAKYPTITFVSAGASDITVTSAKLNGILTMHGVEKPVVLDLEILGEVKDPWGNKIASFTATTTINRKDFGIEWNKALETGQLLVGEEVTITLEIAGLLQG
ncbi:MAG: YceI family protein [Candidatus Omnitrophica bacterium]|nr:YceI family protein [Candidatus Omnitrophota bacterium]